MKPFPLLCVNISQNHVNILKMALTVTAKEKILDSRILRQKIAIAMGVIERTVQNWVYDDNRKLETPTVLALIIKETGLRKDEIISSDIITSDPGDEVEHIIEKH